MIIKYFDNFWPINKIHNILKEEDLDLIFEDLDNDLNCRKSELEIEFLNQSKN